jgi:hypothetical protein
MSATCEVCGNLYDKPIEILHLGEKHIFDSFECAISALAPVCAHCGVRVIGHGLEAEGEIYCCNFCATRHGETRLQDRA